MAELLEPMQLHYIFQLLSVSRILKIDIFKISLKTGVDVLHTNLLFEFICVYCLC